MKISVTQEERFFRSPHQWDVGQRAYWLGANWKPGEIRTLTRERRDQTYIEVMVVELKQK